MSRSTRTIYQLGTGTIAIGSGWLHATVMAPEPYSFWDAPSSRWSLAFALVHLCISYGLGLPELVDSRLSAISRGFVSAVATFGVLAATQTILATPLLPRSSSALMGLVLPLWAGACWNFARYATGRAATKHRVFVVGRHADSVADQLVEASMGQVEKPFTVVGSLDITDVTGWRTVVEQANAATTTVLVLDTAAQADIGVVEQAAALHGQGTRIRTLSLFYEQWLGQLPHTELARVSLLFDVGELHRARYVRAKRVIDLGFGVAGLVALVPLICGVVVANRFGNRGPLFFRQERVGRMGTPIEILKLRTMLPCSSSDDEASAGGRWTEANDSRITPFGAWLRKTHLDELPQAVNVLRGDLSLVGPRPEQPHYVEILRDKIPFYDVRHLVRPGVTGWAQVKQGYAADTSEAYDKLQYDFFYLRRQGWLLDVRIMWRTVRGVLRGAGR